MKLKQFIASVLDTDLYKLSMGNAVCRLYPRALVRYTFINRGKTVFPKGFAAALREQVDGMATATMTKKQKEKLAEKCPFLDPVYLDFLEGYRFDPSEVIITELLNGFISVEVEGPWYRTIMWEVPLLALISELYYVMKEEQPIDRAFRKQKNVTKADFFLERGILCAEFGTRRRYSLDNQREVLEDFIKREHTANKTFLLGTSNVLLAIEYDIKAIGTQAHEWYMFHAGKYGYRMANTMGMERWVNVYNGDLGIALPDTFTNADFRRAFDMKFTKLFDGVRWDSGDAVKFTLDFAKHYQQMGVNPCIKSSVYSNALNLEKTDAIWRFCKEMREAKRPVMMDRYAIGTFFTNDVGPDALNIVIKMSECKPWGDDRWIPVVKISDDVGKHTGPKEEIDICMRTLNIPTE